MVAKRAIRAQAKPVRRNTAPAPGSSLGDLSPEVEELDLTFGWFGSEIRVNPDLSELDIIDFAEEASKVEEKTPEAVAVLKNTFRIYIHSNDFDTFWLLSRKHRVRIETLMETMTSIMEAISGRPTGQLSDSADGLQSTKRNSKAGSSLRVIHRLETEGRPDLALAVVQASEALAVG